MSCLNRLDLLTTATSLLTKSIFSPSVRETNSLEEKVLRRKTALVESVI